MKDFVKMDESFNISKEKRFSLPNNLTHKIFKKLRDSW